MMLSGLVGLLQDVHGLLLASSPMRGCGWLSTGLRSTGGSPLIGPLRAVPLNVSMGVTVVTLGLPCVDSIHPYLRTHVGSSLGLLRWLLADLLVVGRYHHAG